MCFNQERKKEAKPKIIGGRKILTISAGIVLANTGISQSSWRLVELGVHICYGSKIGYTD